MSGSGREQSAGMWLDHLVMDPGSGGPDLAHSPADKQGAANALHKDIEPGTTDAGRWADDETNAVVKAFDAKDGHGWLTSGAVSKAHKIWGEQVQGLVGRLAQDESAIRSSSSVLTGTDIGTGARVHKVSIFDTYS
ncbi:hypothetical protein GA0115256_114968 [Streptomyces sp. DconLS]|nr:hypothetical protein GA0115256_114968 [Streptomyces sp. DconLS]SCF95689.1 hypothetical protein GA0115258_118768 [Streptomyces sp. LamerLS-31b]